MNQLTTTNSATIVPPTRGQNGEMARAAGKQEELTAGRNPNELSESSWGSAALLRATVAARTELRAAASAAAEATVLAQAIAVLLDEALTVLGNIRTSPGLAPITSAVSPGEANSLSPREREVLALVAEGRTNKAIADALYVSPNTVKTHVTSLLNKLHADSRVQLAAFAAKRELGLYRRAASGAVIDSVLL